MKRTIARASIVALVTLLALEAALQAAFPALPPALIQRMPQYRERAGFQLQTAHGAREYPAYQQVRHRITPTSGDLFRLTCLSAADAQPLDAYNVAFTRDSHGFRNPAPWPADLDLAIIGDSFTAAESVVEPFWSGLSNATLALGLPGSGTLEQIRLLRAFALPRQPDTIVMAFFAGNDLADNLLFAGMMRDGKSWHDALHENRSPLDYLVSVHLALFIRDALAESAVSGCHYPQIANTAQPTAVAFYDAFLPVLALDSETLAASDMFRITRDAVVDLATELESRGIRFVFVYIPQKAELHWRYLDDAGKRAISGALDINAADIDANLDAQRNLWRAELRRAEIDWLDLAPALSTAVAEGQAPYFFGDTHWNQLGHNIARQTLRKFLN